MFKYRQHCPPLPLGCLCSTLTPSLRLCLKADPDLIILFPPIHPGLGGFGSQTQADGTWSNFSRAVLQGSCDGRQQGHLVSWLLGPQQSPRSGRAGSALWELEITGLRGVKSTCNRNRNSQQGVPGQSCPTVEGEGLQGSWLRSLGVWPGRVWGLLWNGSTVR